jgi:hypothetical protein
MPAGTGKYVDGKWHCRIYLYMEAERATDVSQATVNLSKLLSILKLRNPAILRENGVGILSVSYPPTTS